ncbi:hypothetical protein [Streptomyces sp. CA-179760]|uniref:hypothetical protein n=1 Tax=Streptomyces sp. CA-179760 TaxID=3240054 RepID=UPI003D8F8BA0
MTSSAALSGAVVRVLRAAAGRRALQVALLVGGVLVLGLLCGERAYAADGVRVSADSTAGRAVSGQRGEPPVSGAGSAQLERAVGERAVRVSDDARESVGGELMKAPAKLPAPPKAPSPAGRPDRSSLPDLSGALDLSGVPDMSGAPDLPDLPDRSTLPDPPKAPALTVTPKPPSVPGLPTLPGLPDPPAMPVTPKAPSVPGLPTLPGLPDPPAMPDLPGLPDLSGLPGPPAPPDGDVALPGAPASPGLPGYPAFPSHPVPVPAPAPAPGPGPVTADPQPAGTPASPGASPATTGDASPEAHGDHYRAPYTHRAAHDHAHHVRRAAHTGPSVSGAVPVGHVPGGRPDGTLCNRYTADNGTPRHGDAHAVTPDGRAPLSLVRGVAARACAAATRDGHRDIPVFPG